VAARLKTKERIMVGVRSGTEKNKAAAAREQAIIEGYKFIELKLLDAGFDGAQGFQALQPSVFVDHVKNTTTYSFAVTGGPLRFERDESRAGRYCQLLDTEINREVLRSVTDAKVVEIVDEKIRAEILSGVKADGGGADDPPMTKEEYMAELDKLRAAGGIPAVDEDAEAGAVDEDAEAGAVSAVAALIPDTTVNPVPAGIRKASKPPTSPFVSVKE